MKKQLLLLLAGSILGSFNTVSAQINNWTERNNSEEIWKNPKGLYLKWYSNSFFKNNEYFLQTASGYTLFGTQNIPSLVLKPRKHIFMEGGIYLKKDFGTEGFVKIAPFYKVGLKKNGYSLTIGNIDANASHKMIDPIFANERLMTNNLEEGFSLKVDRKNIYSETWINWEKQQYYYSDFNEKLLVGHNTLLPILRKNKFTLSLPVQAIIAHSGGQLDTVYHPTVTLVNLSAGLKADWRFDRNRGINKIGFNANYLIYKDLSNNSGLAYSKGTGFYSNLNLQFAKHFTTSLSYWKAETFIAPKGDILNQSVSNNPTNMSYLEPNRELIQLGFAYEKRIDDFANISVRLNPFYDVQNARVDYWYSLMLTMQPTVRIFKKKFN